jgi:hypothetical protein
MTNIVYLTRDDMLDGTAERRAIRRIPPRRH